MTNVKHPPLVGDEREMLIAFLDLQRDTFLWKLEGLSEDQLRRKHDPSGMSLLGMLKHLIRVERVWFQARMMGEYVDGQSNDETAWKPNASEPLAELLEQHDIAWRAANGIARELDLHATAKVPSDTYGEVSLQWLLLHMIDEYARHCGHADLMRESIDGVTGYRRPSA